jgi:hypothetical protein
MIGFRFEEVMEGTFQRDGERFDRRFVFRFDVRAPNVLHLLGTAVGRAVGEVTLDGIAKHAPAEGTLQLSPFTRRRIRYRFSFTGTDGQRYRFDGWKSIEHLSPLRTWTTLPGKVFDSDGRAIGRALLRFRFSRHLRGLLSTMRLVPTKALHARAL